MTGSATHPRKRSTYPAYKPSGMKWVDDIPEHWTAKRLRFLVSEPLKYGANESAELDDPDLPRYIRITDVDENGRLRDDTFKSLPEDVARPYLLKEGDLLLARSVATVGKSFYYEPSWGRAAYAGYLIRARFNPARIMPRFVNYYTNSQQYWQWLASSFIQATIQNVSAEKYANLIVPIPSLDEQKAIASFLDRETARIDALLEKKQRQIELLQEKRYATISHSVTKGIDSNAKMKDSGIEWLGEIPSHWAAGNIRRFAKMKTGHTPSRNHPEYWENCTIPWFSLADVWQLRDGRRKYLEETKENISELGLKNSAAELLPKRTVIFSRTASIGFSGIMPTAMATTHDFWNWICGPRLLPDYLLYLFRAMAQEFQALTMGSTHKTIYQPIAASISICVPPVSEQRTIVETIDRETNRIDALIDRVQESIYLLREYRTALISAAVTGKIDVR